MAASFAVGYGVGYGLNKVFGLSDKISDWLASPSVTDEAIEAYQLERYRQNLNVKQIVNTVNAASSQLLR